MPGIGNKPQSKAKKAYEEAILQALKTYWGAKEQADIIYKKTVKKATDIQVKREAKLIYKETLAQARKARDEVIDDAQKAFTIACQQQDGEGSSGEGKNEERLAGYEGKHA